MSAVTKGFRTIHAGTGIALDRMSECREGHGCPGATPKCQFLKKEKWLENRLKDFLPINYFHVVFTIPDSLNSIILNNQKIMYDHFFRSVAETLKLLSADKKYIGGRIGFITVLHTWGQNLSYHPHIHCIVTGGGLSDDQKKWINSRSNFLFPVKVLGNIFRAKFLESLKKEHEGNNINNRLSKNDFIQLLNSLYQKEWVTYSKPPFKKPETVFEYLAQYTHRIAISNYRILAIKNDNVLFKWRDYSDGNKQKIMSIHAHEFIRRFLLHVLPKKFVKIRHFGLFGNRNKRKLLGTCRKLLNVSCKNHEKNVESWKEIFIRVTGTDIDCCPECGKGRMVVVREIKPFYCHSPYVCA